MKFINIVTILFLILGVVYANDNSYSIEQFLKLVEEYSKDLKLAEKDLEMADARYREALSTALPKISASGTYNRNLGKMFLYVDFPDRETGQMTKQKFQMNFNNAFSATAMLQQTLFSLQVGDALRAAKQYEKLTEYIYQTSHQTIIGIAKKGYYRALLLHKVWEVKKAAEDNARENYENVKNKYDNGLVSEMELLQAEVNWKNKEPETTQARRNYEIGMIMLKNFAGISVDTQLSLSGNLETYPAFPDSMAFDKILEYRPDYNALLWERDLRETNVSAQRSEYYPYLTGHFVYNYSATSDEFKIDRENSSYFVGINLEVPVYFGGYRSAQVQKAKIDLNKSEIRIGKTQDDIMQNIRNVRLRLHESYSRILSAQKTQETAFRAFEIAQTSADNGLATQLELKDSRIQVELAVLNYYVATYDFIGAYVDWELATGSVAYGF